MGAWHKVSNAWLRGLTDGFDAVVPDSWSERVVRQALWTEELEGGQGQTACSSPMYTLTHAHMAATQLTPRTSDTPAML